MLNMLFENEIGKFLRVLKDARFCIFRQNLRKIIMCVGYCVAHTFFYVSQFQSIIRACQMMDLIDDLGPKLPTSALVQTIPFSNSAKCRGS